MLEVMFAFGLFVIISASVLPLLSYIYKEKISIQEEASVLYMLEEEVHRYLLINTIPVTREKEIIVKKEKIRENVMNLCSTWTGANGREYERCLLVAK